MPLPNLFSSDIGTNDRLEVPNEALRDLIVVVRTPGKRTRRPAPRGKTSSLYLGDTRQYRRRRQHGGVVFGRESDHQGGSRLVVFRSSGILPRGYVVRY